MNTTQFGQLSDCWCNHGERLVPWSGRSNERIKLHTWRASWIEPAIGCLQHRPTTRETERERENMSSYTLSIRSDRTRKYSKLTCLKFWHLQLTHLNRKIYITEYHRIIEYQTWAMHNNLHFYYTITLLSINIPGLNKTKHIEVSEIILTQIFTNTLIHT